MSASHPSVSLFFFDSTELNAVLLALVEGEISTSYSTDVTQFIKPARVPFEKEVGQSNTLTLKLFLACLEVELNWGSGVGIISGEHLNLLRFADHIFFIENSSRKLSESSKQKEVDLNINATKVMQSYGMPKVTFRWTMLTWMKSIVTST